MNQVEKDIARLHREGVSVAPDIAINQCIGRIDRNDKFADNHRPFVVKKRATSGSSIWEEGSLAEFNTLDEALGYPGAKPYGSSTLCSPCRKLPTSF